MFVVFKRSYLFLALALCLVVLLLPPLTVLAVTETKKPVIAIDAGHGGYDGGVKGTTTGAKEADVNLALALLLKGYFESDGKTVVLTRNKDVSLDAMSRKQKDMQARVQKINAADPSVLISLHVNFYPSASRRGIQVFYTKKSDETLAQTLQEALNKKMNVPTIGRTFAPLYADYYILANSRCPSALIECGFFSNPQDEALLMDENYRMRLAYEIFCAAREMV